jgi:hypothetical protein
MLGRVRHLYSLITAQQHSEGKRGSVYVRGDGRIFDYSFDDPTSAGDMFDTGYTIYDLERTGRYVSVPVNTGKRKSAPLKYHSASQGK